MKPTEAFGLLQKVPLSTYREAFEQFERSAFRLECLPTYRVSDEAAAYAAYLATGTCDRSFNEPWLKILDASRASGRAFDRVRLLPSTRDDSSYFKFEADCGYRRSIEHGERIRFLSHELLQPLATSMPLVLDFWLFDDRRAFVMHYDFRGTFLGASEMTSPLVDQYREFAAGLSRVAYFENIDDVLQRY